MNMMPRLELNLDLKFLQRMRKQQKYKYGILLVFNITNEESFHNLLKCYNEVNDQAAQNCQIVLIGSKIDLESHRKISTLQAKAFADQHKMQYIETSAKTNYNIDQLFENTAMEIVDKIEKKQIEFSSEDSGIKLGNYYKQQNTKNKKMIANSDYQNQQIIISYSQQQQLLLLI